jgi:hypothetical protein
MSQPRSCPTTQGTRLGDILCRHHDDIGEFAFKRLTKIEFKYHRPIGKATIGKLPFNSTPSFDYSRNFVSMGRRGNSKKEVHNTLKDRRGASQRLR